MLQICLQLFYLFLSTRLFCLKAFIKLYYEVDLILLAIKGLLHLVFHHSCLLVVLRELCRIGCLHLSVLISHLLLDFVTLLAQFEDLTLQFGNQVRLVGFLRLESSQILHVTVALLLQLLILDVNLRLLNLKFNFLLLESALGGNQLLELLRVQFLYVLDFDEGLISLCNVFLNLSEQYLYLANFRALKEVHCELVARVGLVRIVKLLKNLEVTILINADVSVINLVRVFTDGHFPNDFDLFDYLCDSWIFDFSLSLFVSSFNSFKSWTFHRVKAFLQDFGSLNSTAKIHSLWFGLLNASHCLHCLIQ